MQETERLIEQLAARAAPVRPLASPARRTLRWGALAVLVVALVALGHGLRPGLWAALAVPSQAIEWAASILTGLCAAYAAFQVSVPGRSPAWALLPVPPLLVWMSGLGWGCLRDFGQSGGQAFAFQSGSWECAGAITMISVPLGLLLLVMVRHAGVVRPRQTAGLTALGAAGLSAAGVTLFHHGESSLMVLLWHLGAVIVLSLACRACGRQLFAWIGHVRAR